MATVKYSGIKLGPGATTVKGGECEFFCEQRAPYNGIPGTANWGIATSYSLNQAIVYEGVSYNSLQNLNSGNQPDITPAFWSPVDGKDGDIWIKVPIAGFPAGGDDVDLYLKAGNTWKSISGAPIQIALTDGQAVAVDAIAVPVAAFAYASIEYTIRRGGGQGRKRQGDFKIMSDGISVQFSHAFDEIGSDVNVPLTVTASGGLIRLQYTSSNEGVAIELSYVIKGWA